MNGHRSNLPPNGFQWDEPLAVPAHGSRRRWWLLILAIAVVVAVVVGLLYSRSHRDELVHLDATIGTPKDLLISFPLNRRPVPGWRVDATDVGLPPEVPMGTLFAGTSDKAYFVAEKPDPQALAPVGWVYGIDLTSGTSLFPPIEMPGFRGISLGGCYGNGAGTAVCVTSGDAERGFPHQVWVIDLDRGQVTFTGPTVLEPQGSGGPDDYSLHVVGNYRGESRLIAVREGDGAYGLGPNAERTWFVPGGGIIADPGFLDASDIPSQSLATQSPSPQNVQAPYRMFSAVDGKDLTPTAPEGATIRKSLLYNGGFAYGFTEPGQRDGLLFYDAAGRLAARYQDQTHDITPVENAVMPMGRLRANPAQWLVFTAAGELLQSIPAPDPGADFKVIGTNVFIGQAGTDQRWQRWDLQTGSSGPVCQLGLKYDYVGSDGAIVIVGGGLSSSTVRAVDPATCTTVWEMTEAEFGKQLNLWKVGTGLIQSTGAELIALHAAP